jgi:hypothetical protein
VTADKTTTDTGRQQNDPLRRHERQRKERGSRRAEIIRLIRCNPCPAILEKSKLLLGIGGLELQRFLFAAPDDWGMIHA